MMKRLASKNDINVLTDIAYTRLDTRDERLRSRRRLLRELDESGGNRDFYVKFEKDEPLAMIQLVYKNADGDPELANGGDIAHIHDLEVRKEMQRRGIGREMVGSIETLAKEKGIKTLTLGVDRANLRAIKLYESMGYVRFKEEEGRTPEEKAYSLKKTIS
ncbi:MAG: GNAT family N-acetyltransferase [Elusimicrobiota bacterium]